MKPMAIGLTTSICVMGCRGNIAPFQPARTMPAGGFAVGIEGSGIGVVSDAGGKLDGTFAIAGRYAINDRIEIGARVGSTRPEIMSKFRLNRGNAQSTAISIAPSVGGFVATATGIFALNSYAQVPILVGIPIGKHELVFSVGVHFAHAINVDTHLWGMALGPGVSAGFVVQPTSWISIIPNIALAMPLFRAGSGGVGSGDTVAYQAGLAIAMGRLR